MRSQNTNATLFSNEGGKEMKEAIEQVVGSVVFLVGLWLLIALVWVGTP